MKAAAVTEPDSGTDRPTDGARPAHRLPFWVNQRLGLLVLVIALSAFFGVLRRRSSTRGWCSSRS